MALFILRIKEVVPLRQPNQDIANFFHHDVKIARDYNKKIDEEEFEPNHRTTLTLHQSNLAQSIVKRWKSFKSVTAHENQQDQEIGPTSNPTDLTNTESRRKLLGLKTFAKDYDLDIFNKNDYDLLNAESREKAHLLINDLVDMCQEVPQTFIGLFHLQPCTTSTSTDKEYASFYEEIIALLPPKWYQLFVREQQRRKMMSRSSLLNRAYSLRVPARVTYRKSISKSNENDSYSILHKENQKNKKIAIQRQSSAPGIRRRSSSSPLETTSEISVEDTRLRLTKPSTTTTQTFEQSEFF
jgi:hypothetical protein